MSSEEGFTLEELRNKLARLNLPISGSEVSDDGQVEPNV